MMSADKTVVSAQPLKVAMLLGHGGRGDKSFNDSAYAGLESAREQYDIEFETADSGTLEENVTLLQQWAEANYDLIIAIGYHNGPAIAQVAESFPQKRFAIIDTEVEGENVWSAVFREYETDYMMGVLAALIAGQGRRVGFIGGVRTPIIRRIESAFSQGIESMNPDIVLNSIYVDRFDDEVMGQYFAEILYARGANVIYQAAGRSGIGAIRAAKKLGKLIISTGGDHSELAPAAVLTSRIKNVHRPVLDVVEAVAEDRFEGGKTASYGFANEGLVLARVRREVVKRLVEHLPSDVSLHDFITRMAEITKRVTSGQIVIDFDQVEETIPELADGQSFDEKSSDE
jgi:basic membrane protein A